VGLNTGSDGGVGSDGADALTGTLTDNGILLVGELLLEGLDGLQGKSLLSDGTAEEGGQVAGGGVDLVGRGRDVEVLDEVLEDGDRLGDLLARDGRNGRNVDGRHCGRNFGGFGGWREEKSEKIRIKKEIFL
jgi:hypothetical protein